MTEYLDNNLNQYPYLKRFLKYRHKLVHDASARHSRPLLAGGFDALGLFERQLWNPSAVIRQLHAEHNIDVFFKIDVITDPDNSSVNVIQVGAARRDLVFVEPQITLAIAVRSIFTSVF